MKPTDTSNSALLVENSEEHHTSSPARTWEHDSSDDLLQDDGSGRSWGFYAFLACGLALTYAVAGPIKPSSTVNDDVASASETLAREPSTARLTPKPPAKSELVAIFPQAEAATAFELSRHPQRPRKRSAAHEGTAVAFMSPLAVTTERAVSAVVVLERSPPRRGALRIHWAVRSGTADAAIDFSDASGTARFADGQSQLALYMPLRNDLLKESDESFEICLDRVQARAGARNCAAITIRDDD
jgi:hypothetical protein